ncbi:MAG: DUF4157 domain-containing protein [Alphaproteobacteria bacterium]|nr:DUF4157 domain-containing protein [Alphaproteobacteria bacterium]
MNPTIFRSAGVSRLPASMCRRFEALLGTAFDTVAIRHDREADRLNRALGSVACAMHDTIFLRDDAPAAGTPEGDWLLAHELAHIAQQRLPRGSDDHAAAEAEACRAADAVTRGLPYRCVVPLDRARPACWEEPGHYYTIYLLALAAGIEGELAYRIAVYGQLPDMCCELDAAVAGYALVSDDAKLSTPLVAIGGTVFSDLRTQSQESTLKDLATLRDIQIGLHALSGDVWAKETAKRVSLLDGLDPRNERELLPFSLALHSLGDSFAHREISTGHMYKPVMGHAWHGAAPDTVGKDRQDFYLEYVKLAYAALCKRAGGAKALGGIDKGQLMGDQLRYISGNTGWNKDEQCLRLRNTAAQIGATMKPFKPEKQDMCTFRSLPAIPGVTIHHANLDMAIRCARHWSRADPISAMPR